MKPKKEQSDYEEYVYTKEQAVEELVDEGEIREIHKAPLDPKDYQLTEKEQQEYTKEEQAKIQKMMERGYLKEARTRGDPVVFLKKQ